MGWHPKPMGQDEGERLHFSSCSHPSPGPTVISVQGCCFGTWRARPPHAEPGLLAHSTATHYGRHGCPRGKAQKLWDWLWERILGEGPLWESSVIWGFRQAREGRSKGLKRNGTACISLALKAHGMGRSWSLCLWSASMDVSRRDPRLIVHPGAMCCFLCPLEYWPPFLKISLREFL